MRRRRTELTGVLRRLPTVTAMTRRDGGSRRWALRCDCGHTESGRDPSEVVANLQAHALETHGLVVPAELLLSAKTEAREQRGTDET